MKVKWLGILLAQMLLAEYSVAGTPQSADALYESAVQLRETKSSVDAIIDLKNALQRDENHLPSLILAGEIYLEQVLGLAAEQTFRKALAQGADRNLVLPMLGEALLQQRKSARLLVELQTEDLRPEARARVHTLRAQAHLERGSLAEAQKELDLAESTFPGALSTQLVKVSWLMKKGDTAAGLKLLDGLAAQKPESGEVWSAYGAMEHARGHFDNALKAYGKALNLTPRNLDVRIARIALLLDLNRDRETTSDFEYISREFPNEGRAAYLRSVAATRAGEFGEAKAALRDAVAAISNLEPGVLAQNPTMELISGLSYYGLGQYEAALGPLKNYVAKSPGDVGARRALGDVQLRLNEPRKAIESLEPVASAHPSDQRTVAMLASAYALGGEAAKASRLLEQASDDGSDKVNTKGKLALLKIDAGHVDAGLTDLAEVFAKNPTDAQNGLALVVTYIRTGRHEKAVEAAQNLLSTEPSNLTYRNLVGVALFTAGDLVRAEQLFTDILNETPDFDPAAINLAKTELQLGKIESARTRLRGLLHKDRDSSKLLLELSRVELAAGDGREALRLAEDAVRASNTTQEAISHLFDLYQLNKENKKALDLAWRAESSAENDFEVLYRLASALLAEGDRDTARTILRRMSRKAAHTALDLLRTAAFQASISLFTDAEFSLFKATQLEPQNVMVRLAQIENSLRRGKSSEAETRATVLLQSNQKNAAGYVFRGQARAMAENYAGALVDFDQANAIRPSTDATLQGYHVLLRQNQPSAARRRLQDWLRKYPEDSIVANALGQDFIRTNSLEDAFNVYAALADKFPGAPNYLNNLAYLSLRRGNERKALMYAVEAFKAAPEDPSVNDTYGWVLVETGAQEEGLKYLRQASARASSDGEIRFHLAAALQKLGRLSEAREELAKALHNDQWFESREQALALQDRLSTP